MERGYRETLPPARLRGLVECAWWARDGPGTRVLPDGCMDLLLDGSGRLSVAGPDTAAFVTPGSSSWTAGVRFHPGALPRLLGVPAAELRNRREPLDAVAPDVATTLSRHVHADGTRAGGGADTLLGALAGVAPSLRGRGETTPWTLSALAHVTARLAAGVRVEALADELGWSPRSLSRQCTAVYGYGPATLRRILRFRVASTLLHAGAAPADVAAEAGYADQPHLTREFRALAGVTPAALSST